jgi:hypothetical protein
MSKRSGQECGRDIASKVMIDCDTPHTLILITAARTSALNPVWKRNWAMSPDSEEPEEILCRYIVPLVDWQGNMQLVKAQGLDYTIYAEERKVTSEAAALFLEMEGRALKAHLPVGMVYVIIGKDSSRWQPQKVCDSWQAEDNLTLMKSEFSPRHIVRETKRTKCRT